MPTRPLPPNTKNQSVNLPETAKRAWGRLAFVRDVSSGMLIKFLMSCELEEAMERGEIAKEAALQAIEDLRAQFPDAVKALKKPKTYGLILIGVFSLASSVPRRSRRTFSARPQLVRQVRAHRKYDGMEFGEGLAA